MRRLRDRDFLRTRESFLFCVVGYAHPRGRVISYLKYVPSDDGRWGKKNERYTRTMPNYTIPSLLNNIKMLRKNYPEYVFHSRVYNIQMSAVPCNHIVERYYPEVKLHALFNSKKLDPLQETTIELVSLLACEANIPKEDFGITGSLLTDIHDPLFSDIDLTICGKTNAWKVKEILEKSVDETFLRKPSEKNRILERWQKNYPLSAGEAEKIYDRRWNYGCFNNRSFSIHALRKDLETVEKYGEKHFYPQGIIEGEAEITSVDDSLFLPCTYTIRGLEVNLRNGPTAVNEVVSYDGFYSGLFKRDEHVAVRGKLELVRDKGGDEYLRILIGSPEARGTDYIKPVT